MIIKGHSCAVIRGTDRFLTPCHCRISTSPAQGLASAPVLPRLWLPASLYLLNPFSRAPVVLVHTPQGGKLPLLGNCSRHYSISAFPGVVLNAPYLLPCRQPRSLYVHCSCASCPCSISTSLYVIYLYAFRRMSHQTYVANKIRIPYTSQ